MFLPPPVGVFRLFGLYMGVSDSEIENQVVSSCVQFDWHDHSSSSLLLLPARLGEGDRKHKE